MSNIHAEMVLDKHGRKIQVLPTLHGLPTPTMDGDGLCRVSLKAETRVRFP
jgi:hypothetical protein